ncbi:MAG: N-acetylmuramoyl-L-alanine amidase [Candidatus Absconditicoccaceae bacterium]
MGINQNFVKYFFIVFLGVFFCSYGFAVDWNLPGINIITRQQWGANESLRYYSGTVTTSGIQASKEAYLNELKEVDFDAYLEKRRSEYQLEVANNYLISNYPNESTADKYNQYYSGKRLKWTESIKNTKTKLIVHHTAENSSGILTTGAAIKKIQDIYKYHTVNRGRGDIGYNFLIDPFGNIYEGRAGGEGVIGAHDKRNNSSSVGVSVLGNFNEQKVSTGTLSSLTKLLTALAKKYNINPTSKVMYHEDKVATKKDPDLFPYVQDSEGYAIAGHKDAGNTACPGTNLYNLLPQIRQQVSKGLNSYPSDSSISTSGASPISDKLISYITSKGEIKSELTYTGAIQLRDQMQKSIKQMKQKYSTKKSIPKPSSKITYKVSLQEAKELLAGNISVLLYELTFNFTGYQIGCLGTCSFDLDGNQYTSPLGTVSIVNEQLVLVIGSNIYTGNSLKITSSKDLIMFKNYKRKSYYSKPRNSFRGTILIKPQEVRNTRGKQSNKFAVINTLLFADYLKGIVETNDGESIEKNKVMAMISKSYALFYLKNIHPNIPSGSDYTAVDSPDVFQKYVGAGAEITLLKRPKALVATKNLLTTFDGYIPILPYFNCSPGFTYSAQEKRGWTDTPYLISNLDTAKCKDFAGHGVGMSGKGAEYRAKKGWTYQQILQYYYPGIKIESF